MQAADVFRQIARIEQEHLMLPADPEPEQADDDYEVYLNCEVERELDEWI